MSDDEGTLIQSEPELDVGRKVSRGAPELAGYELQKCLGTGSFGQVWAGLHLRTGQQVAVKVLKARSPEVWATFDRILDPLSRPGCAWARWRRSRFRPMRFTHDKGLLHCDLKPSNVLLDEQRHVRLVDFGQSTRQGGERALGTLGYMPPEQVQGLAPEVSWDIYGLGALAYYLLAGRLPRLAPGELKSLGGSTQEVLQEYSDRLQANPLTALARLNPAVNGELAALIEACLALDPARPRCARFSRT